MKNLLSAVLTLLFVAQANFTQAAPLSQKKIDRELPDGGRCRAYSINASIFGQGISTTVVLCCRANNMTIPPFTCFELPQGRGALRGYLLLSDFGAEAQEIFKKEEGLKTITITKSDSQDIEGKQYYIKSDTYKILENEKKERYIEIVLEPTKP